MISRQTLVVHGPLAARDARLEAARAAHHGVQILSVAGLAARLAGGFTRPIDLQAIKQCVAEALPDAHLRDLEAIKDLPGMISAAADTLCKVWDVGHRFDEASEIPRVQALAALERAVVQRLPAGMSRPADLVEAARARLRHAPSVLGPIELRSLGDVPPVFRALLIALASQTRVVWNARGRTIPDWLTGTPIEIVQGQRFDPPMEASSAANELHECVEAMRWARELVACGRAKPNEIAIVAASTASYDDAFAALRRDANFPLRFAHGVPALVTRDGQAAAALADVLHRGLRRPAILRLASLCNGPEIRALPDGWYRACPHGLRASDLVTWRLRLAEARFGPDAIEATLSVLELLAKGIGNAQEAGEAILSAGARALWRRALIEGPPSAVGATLTKLRFEDAEEQRDGVVWAPASMLAASPRPFVRLIGLSSRGWPRTGSEEQLLPEHILGGAALETRSVSEQDRADFEDILQCASGTVVLSRPRRDGEGRLLGRSPLIPARLEETYLRRNAPASHALSEGDRLFGRPSEFAMTAHARAAQHCWREWQTSDQFLPHDGLVRPDHPGILRILARTHSASSLKRLLRDAPGFVWRYGLGMQRDEADEEALTLDARGFGNLLHNILERVVGELTADPTLVDTDDRLKAAVERCSHAVAKEWEAREILPPSLVWRRQLAYARDLAHAALLRDKPDMTGHLYAEVAFGGEIPKRADAPSPWSDDPVTLPGTDLKVQGYIDRLDVLDDGRRVRVHDYKTGSALGEDAIIVGGAELQRPLYALAVRSLLGRDCEVEASLHYVKPGVIRPLDNVDAVIDALADHVRTACDVLRHGKVAPGPDTTGKYADFLFALPANAVNGYAKRKEAAFRQAVGDATRVWAEK